MGLLDEVSTLNRIASERLNDSETANLDYTLGIYQSIGATVPMSLMRLRSHGCPSSQASRNLVNTFIDRILRKKCLKKLSRI
jgi:hypothetical protein